MKLKKLYLSFILLIGMASQAMAIPTYTITDLGTLGCNYSYARAVNNLGQVVGQGWIEDYGELDV